MRAVASIALACTLGLAVMACELVAGIENIQLTGGVDGSTDARHSDAEPPRDAGDAGHDAADGAHPQPDARMDVEVSAPDAAPIQVLQRPVCPYMTVANTFSCAFQLSNSAGNAFLVHFYFNYGAIDTNADKLTDNNSNDYSFLNIDDVVCPAGPVPGQACCTAVAGTGTCQGWAVATNVSVKPNNPATITFTLSSSGSMDVMGMELLEVSGLADVPLDQGKSEGTSPGTTVATPTIVTSAAGDLIMASFAAYSAGSMLTQAAGWTLSQDDGYFAGAEFRIGGAAGSSYSVTGAITAMAQPGTSTIFALKAR
jgi:hypothetical protein